MAAVWTGNAIEFAIISAYVFGFHCSFSGTTIALLFDANGDSILAQNEAKR